MLLIDLTHTLDEKVPTWRGSCGFSSEIKMDYPQGLRAMTYRMHAGVGTHLDAPSHFFPEGAQAADIPLEHLIVPLVVIDVTEKAHPDFFLSVEDILSFERIHGPIAPRSFVAAYTGWDRFWNDPEKYRNPTPEGGKRFPGFSADAARLLIQRDVSGIGIDTLSPDGSHTKSFPVHEIILGAGKYIVENLTNLDRAAPVGMVVILLPLKIRMGAEAPLRAVALKRP